MVCKVVGPAGVFQGSVHNLCWDTLTMTRTHPLKVGKIWRVNGMGWEQEQDRNGSWGQKSGPSNMRMRETSEGLSSSQPPLPLPHSTLAHQEAKEVQADTRVEVSSETASATNKADTWEDTNQGTTWADYGLSPAKGFVLNNGLDYIPFCHDLNIWMHFLLFSFLPSLVPSLTTTLVPISDYCLLTHIRWHVLYSLTHPRIPILGP